MRLRLTGKSDFFKVMWLIYSADIVAKNSSPKICQMPRRPDLSTVGMACVSGKEEGLENHGTSKVHSEPFPFNVGRHLKNQFDTEQLHTGLRNRKSTYILQDYHLL